MEANRVQHGGTHYVSEYQHWDMVADLQLDYFDANATKYITRHRQKNGVEDVKKAQHYVQKKIELIDQGRLPQPTHYPRQIKSAREDCTVAFLSANGITDWDSDEAEFILLVSTTETMSNLRAAVAAAERMIRSYDSPVLSSPAVIPVRSDVAALLEKKDYTAEGWLGDMQVLWKCNHCKTTFHAIEGMLPSQAHTNCAAVTFEEGAEPTVDYVRQ